MALFEKIKSSFRWVGLRMVLGWTIWLLLSATSLLRRSAPYRPIGMFNVCVRLGENCLVWGRLS